MVTKTNLTKLFPNAKPALVAAVLSNWDIAEDAGINTPLRRRHFFANIGVETGGLTKIVESLTYSSAQRIYDVFKGPPNNRRFKSVAECKPYVKQPIKLGIKVYGGRMGNKADPSTDGYDYRGGGMLQTTGREGYATVGYEDNPKVLQSDPDVAFHVAVQEWTKRGCNALADRDDAVACRKAINGGTNGIDEVQDLLLKAAKVWPDAGDAPATKTKPGNIYDGSYSEEVFNVQTRLDELGYHEVGTLDGKWGSRTAGAITTFQTDNNLPLEASISPALLAALMTAKPRVIDAERANTTVADLRKEGAADIKQADQTKWAGYGLAAMGSLSGAKQGLENVRDTSSTIREIVDYLQPIYGFLHDNFWIILGGAGAFFVYKSGILQRIRVQKHRDGSDVSA